MKKNTIVIVVKSSYYTFRLGSSLFFTWLTLGFKVRKVRKLFEKQLVDVGISRADAKYLSRIYLDLKDQILAIVKSSITSSGNFSAEKTS
ncbi:MAG: hypothetical protein QXI71_05505 [Candidatus Bathyarchaeia archaeon]